MSGLESETSPIKYRRGESKAFSTTKMPGLHKVGNVTMRKGVFVKDAKFWDWYFQIAKNTMTRRTVVVSLLDESGKPRMAWTLHVAQCLADQGHRHRPQV